jgi:outer membrane protein OmpA-like peptidoglycan-associated protein
MGPKWAIVGISAALLLPAVARAGSSEKHAHGDSSAKSDAKLPPLKVSIDRSKVDLADHHLEVKLSRAAESVHIKVMDDSGDVLADETQDFKNKPAGTPLIVTWSPKNDSPVARIEVFGYDTHGYYAGVAIVPWSVSIPHQEVLFDTDKALIKASEKPKLEDSYAKIKQAIKEHKDLGSIKLFIGGHTDTVGSAAHNMELSRRRARAIAGWFRHRGIHIPVYYAGFGESVPAVKTADNVDEPRNRRVDYILAIDPPQMKSGTSVAWHHG